MFIRLPIERLVSYFYWAHSRSNLEAPLVQVR